MAPIGRRLAAFLIDAFASAAIAGLFVHRHSIDHHATTGVASHLPGFWSLLPLAMDYVAGLTLAGQTLGMRLLSLRVIRTDEPVPVGLTAALIRTLLLIILVPAIVFDRANRGLHDRVTDTAVVYA